MNQLTVAILIFLISFGLRVWDITVPLNTDETLWLNRGMDFIQHLTEGNLMGTYQRHHPGVINLWVIGIGHGLTIALHQILPNLVENPWTHPCFIEIFEPPICPVEFHVAPRLIQAVLTSAGVVIFYQLGRRLFGDLTALLATALLGFSPFFLAYQRFITTDALQTHLGILAVFLFLFYLQEPFEHSMALPGLARYGFGRLGRTVPQSPILHQRWKRCRRWPLISSGILMGLSISAKVTSLLLWPGIFIGIFLIESHLWKAFPARGWKQRIQDLTLWGGIVLLSFFLLWPTMWVSPAWVVGKMANGLFGEVNRGALFFRGELTDSPGIMFYPFVLLYRLSPILQVGCILGLIYLFLRIFDLSSHKSCPGFSTVNSSGLSLFKLRVSNLLFIILVIGCFLVSLSGFSNKIDRYITFVIPGLAILSAVGWQSLFNFLKPNTAKVNLFGLTAIVVVQFCLMIAYLPYLISYYNPLLGGIKSAQNIFMVGQGEGLESAASWFNQSPYKDQLAVASWYPLVFGAYFNGEVLDLKKFSSPYPDKLNWTQSHRLVLYLNQLQRQLPNSETLDYITAQEPLYVVNLRGANYVEVYPGVRVLPEEIGQIQNPVNFTFGNQIQLLGYDINSSENLQNSQKTVTFYWQFLTEPDPDLKIFLAVQTTDGKILDQSQSSLVQGYVPLELVRADTLLRDVHQVTLPAAPETNLQLAVTWISTQTGLPLQALDADRKLQTPPVVLGSISTDAVQ
ncbi:MAG: ArnT family glycosyltransferase [Microcoleaceae cyanobacterium]